MTVTTRSPNQRTTAGSLRRQLYYGLQARVAAKLGVRANFVSRVMSGKKTSKRVSAAVEAEIARIEQKVSRHLRRCA